MTDETDETRTCVDCDSTFILTTADQAFFERRALYLPKRCLACRKLRRLVTDAATIQPLREVRRGF